MAELDNSDTNLLKLVYVVYLKFVNIKQYKEEKDTVPLFQNISELTLVIFG